MELLYFLLLGFAVLMYVVLDGFDLGLGILYPWFPKSYHRDMMMRSIAHVWDGNETWLVFGGVVLLAAFPTAYAALLPAVYLPVVLMLLALIFRGVAFEYRFKAERSRRWWDLAFALGSSVASFSQGLMLGTLIESGGQRLLTPFTILTGFAVMAGYALLGATYLIVKSHGELQQRARRMALGALALVMVAMAAVSLWNFLMLDPVRERWLAWMAWLWPLPATAALVGWVAWRSLRQLHTPNPMETPMPGEATPFFCAIALFVLGFGGLVVSIFPDLIPGQLTIHEAAAPDSSLHFLLPGVCIFLPLILAYTLWGYRIFRGKVHDFEEGY